MSVQPSRRRICFVTGTRAEFGLMRTTLLALRADERVQLQLVATGMHLDEKHGGSIGVIRGEGWQVDAVVPWDSAATDASATAHATGAAMATLASTFARLEAEIVLVVGDRVEAFAAASAGFIGGRVVAHVHGGDRAQGQVDDSLRHAISKLAHLHFPATAQSAARLLLLGEDEFRIHELGSPAVDGLTELAGTWGDLHRDFPSLRRRAFALLVLHPSDSRESVEERRAEGVLKALREKAKVDVVAVYPNNDPGSPGIIRCWERFKDEFAVLERNLSRPTYLGLLREAAFLIGNSSSGAIEAATFGTPAIDIGDRQKGRERSGNAVAASYEPSSIADAIAKVWRKKKSIRFRGKNVYGQGGAGARIAERLATVAVSPRLHRKLISY